MRTTLSTYRNAALAATIWILSAGTAAADCGTAHASAGPNVVKQASETEPNVKDVRPDIVETAIGAGSFETLVAAVRAAGLVEILQSEGPFTVFAPTDEAFAKLPKGTIEDLLKPENKQKLAAILTYHVVPGQVTSADIVKVTSAKTAQGQDLAVRVENGRVWIDNAAVARADVMASNGVIHVIDTVLLPKM